MRRAQASHEYKGCTQPSAVLADSSVLLKSLRAVWRDSRKRPGKLAKPAQMLADYHLR